MRWRRRAVSRAVVASRPACVMALPRSVPCRAPIARGRRRASVRSPQGGRRVAAGNLRETSPRRPRRALRQAVEGKEAGLGDLPIRASSRASTSKLARHEDEDVVAPRDATVEEDAVKARRVGDLERRLLAQLPHQRLHRRLARLDTPSGQVPAGGVGVTHKEDAVVPVIAAPRTPSVRPRERRQ